ncbi:MAG: helix-turn-helix domain-containing protein [candidate division Zixibacteria bacterium]|nr:helix-turn-helix domain-containing protein [candidate division Zixibacteria bacterium]
MVDFRGKLTVKELAKILEVDPDTIRNWSNQKKIRCYRHPVNNYRLFDLEEVRKDLDLNSSNSISSSSQVKELKP